jgi:hypothetical protein
VISLSGLTIGELAAYIAGHLHNKGIETVLVGGACISIYSANEYSSFDLDFVITGSTTRQKLRAALAEIDFTEENRYFVNPQTPFFVEFPSGPLAIGAEPPSEIRTLRFSTGNLRLLSPTDCVKDRLAAFYHWKDQQSFEQAILIARDHTINIEEVGRWSVNEGFAEVYEKNVAKRLSEKQQ